MEADRPVAVAPLDAAATHAPVVDASAARRFMDDLKDLLEETAVYRWCDLGYPLAQVGQDSLPRDADEALAVVLRGICLASALRPSPPPADGHHLRRLIFRHAVLKQ